MRHLFVLTLLINLAAITFAFGFIGLMLALGLFGAIYYFGKQKFGAKKAIPEKLAFAGIHLAGVLAVAVAFNMPELTAGVFIAEFATIAIFSATYSA